MTRSRWTAPRLFTTGVLFGRGRDADVIAREVHAHPKHARDICRYYGWAFGERPEGNLTIHLPPKLLDALEQQALKRGRTPEALVGKAVGILAEDPTLLANVLDDDDAAPRAIRFQGVLERVASELAR